MGDSPRGWMVVRVRPQLLRRALINMERQGCECYAPRARVIRRGRWVREPMFPGYVFARHPGGRFSFLRGTFGVLGFLLSSGDAPAELPDYHIEELRQREGADGLIDVGVDLRPGEEVQVKRGSAILSAVISEVTGQGRVFALTHVLGAQRRVEVSSDDISR